MGGRSKERTALAIRHSPHESLGSFAAALSAAGWSVREILSMNADAKDWRDAAAAPVLIVMGGTMGVYEKDIHPFLEPEIAMLRERIARQAATLGICLGSQLIAEAASSRVYHSGRREVGWYPVELTMGGRADPILGNLDWPEKVFHWHQDTFDPPLGAIHLASSELFGQQAFRIGSSIYGIQFHPEVVAAEIPHWIEEEGHLEFGQVDGIQSKAELLEGGSRYGAALERLSRELIARFLLLS
jgi:GMP synthase (glutamine-hydrolysing)